MSTLSPSQKLIKGIQSEYGDNQSPQIRLSKGEFNDLSFKHVGSVIPMISAAKRTVIAKGLLVWPAKVDYCILNMQEIKKEKI